MKIHENHSSNIDGADIPSKEVLEHDPVVDQVKCIAIVKQASIDSS